MKDDTLPGLVQLALTMLLCFAAGLGEGRKLERDRAERAGVGYWTKDRGEWVFRYAKE